MTQRRGGLGRGLGALIPVAETEAGPPIETAPASGARFAEIPVSAIVPNPQQPRTVFDEEALAELVASIHEVGLLQPVVVRPTTGDRFELVMGERRWRAATAAGLERVPAIVRETADEVLLRDALLENLHREQLNPLEEAAAYEQLLQEFGATHDELARRVGKSRSHVTNTLRLLRLSPTVQRRVAAGVLTAGHARALLTVEEPARQDELAERIVAEGLSVRNVEEAVAVRGGVQGAVRQRMSSGPEPQPDLEELSVRLSDRWDTRVSVVMGRRKGKITVEFASREDLERILALLGDAGPRAGGARAAS